MKTSGLNEISLNFLKSFP